MYVIPIYKGDLPTYLPTVYSKLPTLSRYIKFFCTNNILVLGDDYHCNHCYIIYIMYVLSYNND